MNEGTQGRERNREAGGQQWDRVAFDDLSGFGNAEPRSYVSIR